MAYDPTLLDGFGDRRGIVVELYVYVADARVVAARAVVVVGQLHERVVLAHRQVLRIGRRLAHKGAGIALRVEGQLRFDLRVERKVFRARQIDGAARLVEREAALLRLP